MKATNLKTVSTVNHYPDFKKVCDVIEDIDGTWNYINIKKDIMYDDHRSWVYFVVNDNKIVKVGETGVPLGIAKANCNQPLKATTNRFGRLAYFPKDATDCRIRTALSESVRKGKVSLWAKKCPINKVSIKLGTKTTALSSVYHKELEVTILDYMKTHGYWPELNVFRK